MASTGTKAGEPLSSTMVGAWTPSYKFVVDTTQRDFSGFTGATFTTYTGAPSVSVTVTSSGVLMVQWGMEAHNTSTTGSTIRIGVLLSGANSASPSTDLTTCCASTNGASGGNGMWSSSRMHIFTGLNAGATTVQLQGYISSFVAGREAVADNVWLLATPLHVSA